MLSGASVRSGDKEYAEKLGAYVLKEAGLTASQIDKLQEMPWKDYYDIATKAQRKLTAEITSGGGAPAGLRFGFGPVGGWPHTPTAPLLTGGGANRGECADDYLFDDE